MPKKNILISAALTAFVLVMLTGVASAYKQVTSSFVAEVTAPPPVTVEAVMPSATVPVILTHQEAALVAADYLGQTDLFSVEIAAWEGADAFEVVFSTGDIVYVSMDGQILAVEAPQTVVITETNNTGNNNNNNNSNNNNNAGNNNSNQEHDSGDDHDDDHDDD